MTLDQSQKQSMATTTSFLSTPRRSLGPINVPQDMTPLEEIKHKNSSNFTVSLLAGDAVGYAHVRGGPLAGRN